MQIVFVKNATNEIWVGYNEANGKTVGEIRAYQLETGKKLYCVYLESRFTFTDCPV